MALFGGLSDAVLAFVTQYGYVAVFVYMVLETAFILHFAPSELVVPFAAAVLVKGPVTFVLFVIDATAGATVGAVLVYTVFERYGESALRRYGRYIHFTERDLTRGQRWFIQWGEGTVFWGRLLPLVRALISVPAGLAEMNFRKFTLYSVAGALVFNTALTYLAYTGAKIGLKRLTGGFSAFLGRIAEHTVSIHTYVVVLVFGLVMVLLATVVWRYRVWIRANPTTANRYAWRAVRAGGAGIGVLFVVSALGVPRTAFSVVAWLWSDLLFATEVGVSPRFTLLITGVTVLGATFTLSEVGRRFPVDRLVGKRWG